MEFSFGVCTYNSADFIIETLESIKYQVVNYGKGVSTILIIADDASTDRTVELVENWMSVNEHLFSKCLLLQSDKNYGIAHNYSKLMEHIETKYFKTIDGDDVFSSCNLYDQIKKLNDNNMSVFFPLKFNEDGIFVSEADYYNMFYFSRAKRDHKKDLHVLESFKPFITPEVCFRRDKYDETTGNFVKKFTQFEDDTSLYFMFKNNCKMRLDFVLEPMILYRVHNNSLSNGVESVAQIKFLDDLHSFKVYVMKSEKNIGIKIVLVFAVLDTFRMKHRFGVKRSLYRLIANKCALKRRKLAEKNQINYQRYLSQVKNYVDEQDFFLQEIKKNARRFVEKLENRGY